MHGASGARVGASIRSRRVEYIYPVIAGFELEALQKAVAAICALMCHDTDMGEVGSDGRLGNRNNSAS